MVLTGSPCALVVVVTGKDEVPALVSTGVDLPYTVLTTGKGIG